MVNLELVLIAAALTGASLNVLKGTINSEVFKPKLLVGGLITAGIAALAAVQVFDVTTLGGITQVVLLGLLTGFSADVTISKLKSKY
jgi:predicted CDP-diglyceride synthetase/phosphatidate cytidylyltransferase